MGQTYSKRALAGQGKQRTFKGEDLQQIAFPLGGIGAGCLHLGGAGNFQDFCLFNRPAFGHSPMTFAAVHCREKGRREGLLRVLEGPVQNPHIYNQGRFGNGGLASGHEGLPHMEAAEFRGEFPFALLKLGDRDLPLGVAIEAYSPLVPGDDIASGLPAAFIRYALRNRARRTVHLQFSFSAQYPGPGELEGHRVRHRRQAGTAGLFFDSDLSGDDPRKASIAVVSPRSDGQKAHCAWFRGGWFDALTMLSNQLLEGRLPSSRSSRPVVGGRRSRLGGTLFWNLELRPGEQIEIPIVYCWHAPNTDLQYGAPQPAEESCCGDGDPCAQPPTYRPYYATLFADAWAVARRAVEQGESLRRRSGRFRRALFSSSLPDYALDAVSANLAILKSPTMLRQEDGMLWCWEGSSYGQGCCPGSCTHVWNYAQALPFLFPALERTLRDQELVHSMDERGHVTFRSALPTGAVAHRGHAAADGQLGGILKVYREWQLSGDGEWLKARYPLVRRSLHYCMQTWDPEQRGALIEPHHNTYDIEFWGPDIMCTSFYLGALQAAAAMARALGEGEDEALFRRLASRGRAFCDEQLWNGEYFEQKVQWKALRAGKNIERWFGEYSEEAQKLLRREGPKYQYGKGCIADGVMGQWLTTLVGLPDALDAGRARRHLQAIFRHNFRNSLRGHANPQRPGYALNDEPGLLLCSWPRGSKPSLPFVYSDEVWTGIEYQVASHMIYAGLVDEGLSLVRAVRLRYDGRVRNPWNEYECGNYYARAMASYAVLLALSGFRYSAPQQRLEMAPQRREARGRFFFSVDSGWGSLHYEKRGRRLRLRIEVEEGELALREVVFAGPLLKRERRLELGEPRTARPGRHLRLEL